MSQTLRYVFENITQDDFKVILDGLKPKDEILGAKGVPLMKLAYGDVMKLIQGQMTPFEMMMFSVNGKLKDDEVLRCPANEGMQFLKWVRDQAEQIIKLAEKLSSTPEPELINAGIDRLDKFGALNTYYAISKDPGDWDRLSELPFELMFNKLLLDKETADIQKEYSRIMHDKAKTKK